jgi:hypothetical protein
VPAPVAAWLLQRLAQMDLNPLSQLPHSVLDYRPPLPEVRGPMPTWSPSNSGQGFPQGV